MRLSGDGARKGANSSVYGHRSSRRAASRSQRGSVSSNQTQKPDTFPLSVRDTFPKAARLRVRREFLALQRRGERRYSRNFIIITSPARTARPRLGVTTSRRYGKAVVRNHMKRRLREFFRVRQTRISPPRDILIIPKSRAQELTFAQLVTELERGASHCSAHAVKSRTFSARHAPQPSLVSAGCSSWADSRAIASSFLRCSVRSVASIPAALSTLCTPSANMGRSEGCCSRFAVSPNVTPGTRAESISSPNSLCRRLKCYG